MTFLANRQKTNNPILPVIEPNKDLKLAVLIDAGNVPYLSVKKMFEEITKYGTCQAGGPFSQATE